MNWPAKTALSLGAIGGVGIPYLTYDQLFLKPIRRENKQFEDLFKNREKLILELNIEDLDPNEDPATAAPKINK